MRQKARVEEGKEVIQKARVQEGKENQKVRVEEG